MDIIIIYLIIIIYYITYSRNILCLYLLWGEGHGNSYILRALLLIIIIFIRIRSSFLFDQFNEFFITHYYYDTYSLQLWNIILLNLNKNKLQLI